MSREPESRMKIGDIISIVDLGQSRRAFRAGGGCYVYGAQEVMRSAPQRPFRDRGSDLPASRTFDFWCFLRPS